MYLTVEKKKEIFKTHGKSILDTGGTKTQIALLTFKINHLSIHLKNHKKDFNTERSLIRMVVKRKKLLKYLKTKNINHYTKLITILGLRK
ncbi:30S ribosomal protein S15 [Blattabacterium cuenoti]|uniref:30S ribosomal protein S15 n=1 Tax=Blattabacterium cuenoti TaxID=1653831 RepID=UPI00163D24C4|nr:30S ribosomal protein S15 [Blattabacterium cuenoti]